MMMHKRMHSVGGALSLLSTWGFTIVGQQRISTKKEDDPSSACLTPKEKDDISSKISSSSLIIYICYMYITVVCFFLSFFRLFENQLCLLRLKIILQCLICGLYIEAKCFNNEHLRSSEQSRAEVYCQHLTCHQGIIKVEKCFNF